MYLIGSTYVCVRESTFPLRNKSKSRNGIVNETLEINLRLGTTNVGTDLEKIASDVRLNLVLNKTSKMFKANYLGSHNSLHWQEIQNQYNLQFHTPNLRYSLHWYHNLLG